jgi:cell wall assembly regulator SMI1
MDALDRWLESHAPQLSRSFGDPVSAAVLSETEALIGRTLPADYVAFARRHDGQRFLPGAVHGTGTLAPIFQAFELLAVSYAESEWRSMREWGNGMRGIEAVGPVQPLYTHVGWWPFTVVHGASVHHCIDLDPAPGGDVGQVIVVAKDDDRRVVIAPSFGAFVERLAAVLSDSVVEISEGGIELSDDALDWLLGN